MSITFVSLKKWQRVAVLALAAAASYIPLSQTALASPGAHGPNGEHLDTANKIAVSINPKFESFTETFEVLGELLEDKLVIYLHDFKSNRPVPNATIEVEAGEQSSSAEYSEQTKAYVLSDTDMLTLLSSEGIHELVLTVMTEDNGDLLVATLSNSNAESDEHGHSHAVETHSEHGNDHDEEHHHHFPWWALLLSSAVFVAGFFLGRMNKGAK